MAMSGVIDVSGLTVLDREQVTDSSQCPVVCTECSGKIRVENSEAVCSDCGLVIGRTELRMDADSLSSDEEASGHGTGAPTTNARHDRGLSTKIGYGTGIEVSAAKQRQFARLRRQHNRARIDSKSERNKLYAYTEIRRAASRLSLPDSVRDQACTLFDSAQSAELLYGRSLEGFAAAVVYAACRVQSLARTRAEVVEVSSATLDELTVAFDAMNRELGLRVGPIDPRDYLARYASTLDLDMAVEQRARECVSDLRERHLIGGKNPSGVAAACLYHAARTLEADVTQAALTEVADVSRLTIRSTLSDLESFDGEA